MFQHLVRRNPVRDALLRPGREQVVPPVAVPGRGSPPIAVLSLSNLALPAFMWMSMSQLLALAERLVGKSTNPPNACACGGFGRYGAVFARSCEGCGTLTRRLRKLKIRLVASCGVGFRPLDAVLRSPRVSCATLR